MKNAKKDLAPRTKVFARAVLQMFARLPKDTAAQVLGRQMLGSGTSIAANYREAPRARSKAEFIAKTGDCLKEADETIDWLERLLAEGFLPASELKPLHGEANGLVASFVTISKRSCGDV